MNIIDKIKSSFFGNTKAQGSDFCDASISQPSRKEVEMRSWTEPSRSASVFQRGLPISRLNKEEEEIAQAGSAGVFTTTKRDLKNSGTNFLMQVNSDTAHNAASSVRPSMVSFSPLERVADSDIVGELSTIRARSRDIVRNSSIGAGIIKLMCRGVIGDGLKLMPAINGAVLGLSREKVKEIENIIENEFSLWAESLFCDSECTLNFYALQDLAFSSFLENGDVFALLTYIKNPITNYSLSINLIESDLCNTPSAFIAKKGVMLGVRKNKYNAPVSYFFKTNLPKSEMEAYNYFSNMLGVDDYREIPAYDNKNRRQLLHIFKKARPGQTRGVPFLAPVLEQLKQIERYTDAELMASVIASKYTVFIKNPLGESIAPESIIGEPGAERHGGDLHLGDGVIAELGEGQDVAIANPARPNAQFADFISFTIKKIGMGLGLPFEVLMQSFTSSYSASRGSLLEAEKTFLKYRQAFINDFCKPIYEHFLDEIVSLGKINAPGYEEPAKRKAYLNAYWLAPKKSQIDELKEVNAAVARIEAGLSNKTVETMNLTGMKYENVLEIRKHEIEMEQEIQENNDRA